MCDLSLISLIVIDVDGTLTDAGLYYSDGNVETKKFCTKDAAGFFTAHWAGIETMILTGRECEATARRMAEMKAKYICQDVKDKYGFLKNFLNKRGIGCERVAYIGDDLNDLYPMSLAGFVCCPADACDEIKLIADYISPVNGGYGVVRDVVSYILKQRNEWEDAYKAVYGIPKGE